MKSFKNVLLYVNGARRPGPVLRRAIAMAGRDAARVRIVDVVEPPSGLIRPLLRGTRFADLEKSLVAARRMELDQAAEETLDDGMPRSITVMTGTPFLEVIRAVRRGRHDLLVTMEPRKSGSARLGSTNLHLLRKCPAPVWILGRGRKRKVSRILAAVDPGEGREDRRELNRRILTRATTQALHHGAELHIVHAWHFYGEDQLRHGFGRTGKADVDRLVGETEQRYRTWLESRVDEYVHPDVRRHLHLLKGDPRRIVPGLVGRHRIDLLVMGTVGRTGVPGFLIGNTAENILADITCAVLAVKPKGFRTPVKS
jgi:nucleotide-binding universal stress UspA family protein